MIRERYGVEVRVLRRTKLDSRSPQSYYLALAASFITFI